MNKYFIKFLDGEQSRELEIETKEEVLGCEGLRKLEKELSEMYGCEIDETEIYYIERIL